MPEPAASKGRMYAAIIERLFTKGWRAGLDEVRFHRSDIESEAAALPYQPG